MAVTLRLARFGKKKVPLYRIVASHKGSKRDGKFIDIVGTFNPKAQPAAIVLKEDRIRHWVSSGAQMTNLVRDILVKSIPGYIEGIEKNRLDKVQKARKARKARLKNSPKKAAPAAEKKTKKAAKAKEA